MTTAAKIERLGLKVLLYLALAANLAAFLGPPGSGKDAGLSLTLVIILLSALGVIAWCGRPASGAPR